MSDGVVNDLTGPSIGRTVLLIAFHFPPIHGSSGVQRTLRFASYLPRYGWRPIVLTITPSAYEKKSGGAGNELPDSVTVHRALGFDAARQLSIRGRYWRALALPDRWGTWRFAASRKALHLIRKERINAIWSTFPIASAHSIGLDVARRTDLPWIAEFRDPMWQGDYPHDPATNFVWKRMEHDIFDRANAVVVTTPGAADVYASRFPTYPAERLTVIQNGYDDDAFLRALASGGGAPRAPSGPAVLLHSGIVYRSERDPTHLFAAIARLKKSGCLTASRFQLLLRASGDDVGFGRDVARLGIDDIVKVEPAIGYLAALREMLSVDGLLVLQASNCNAQIPAKLYEYLRAGRPIVALTDPVGDTARTLQAVGTGILARLDSVDDIEKALRQFIAEVRSGTWRRPLPGTVAAFSRQAQTGQLARLLDMLAAERQSAGA